MDGLREIESRVCLMAGHAEEMLQLTHEALRHEKVELGEMSEKMGAVLRTDERELIAAVAEAAQKQPDGRLALQDLVSVVAHLGRIGGCMDSVLQCVETKMRDRIPFSSQATHDLTFLFESAQHLLRCAKDLLLTRNAVLTKYVQETGGTLRDSIGKFSLDHEARLLSGRCRPEASAVFLQILDSVSGIIGHTRALAERVVRAPRD
jgi:Na+/phosphate symporter